MTGAQLGFGFDQILEEQRTAHIPSTIDEAVPFFRRLIAKHHAAMMAGDVDAVMAIRKEADDHRRRRHCGACPYRIDADFLRRHFTWLGR